VSKITNKIDISIQRGHETDRLYNSAMKGEHLSSGQKSFTVRGTHNTSLKTSPKRAFGSATKTIFTMKVPSNFQKSTSKDKLSVNKYSNMS
jgi:hypothetical protein